MAVYSQASGRKGSKSGRYNLTTGANLGTDSSVYQEADWASWGWAVGALGGAVSQYTERANIVADYKANIQALQLSYDWSVSEGNRQKESVNTALRAELFNQQMNARLNSSNIDAALSAAGREGKTAGKIQQATAIHESISSAQTTSAARQKMEDINMQMSAAYMNTSLRMNQLYKQTRTSTAGSLVGGLLGAVQGGMQGAQTMRGFSLYF